MLALALALGVAPARPRPSRAGARPRAARQPAPRAGPVGSGPAARRPPPGAARRRQRRRTGGASARSPASAAAGGRARASKPRVYTFGGLDVEGKLKAPQLLYFRSRMRQELDTSNSESRSFLKELERTADEKGL